jgi:hypothetical protein
MEENSPDRTHGYRPSRNARAFFAVMGFFMLILGVWLLSMSLPDCIDKLRGGFSLTSQVVTCLMPVIGCFLVISGILSVRVYWKRILKLTTEAVEVEFFYGLRTLKFDDILGRRSRTTQFGSCTVLVPKEKRLRKLVIKEGFVVDDFYRNWIASLTDLDAADTEKRRAAGKLHFWES